MHHAIARMCSHNPSFMFALMMLRFQKALGASSSDGKLLVDAEKYREHDCNSFHFQSQALQANIIRCGLIISHLSSVVYP